MSDFRDVTELLADRNALPDRQGDGPYVWTFNYLVVHQTPCRWYQNDGVYECRFEDQAADQALGRLFADHGSPRYKRQEVFPPRVLSIVVAGREGQYVHAGQLHLVVSPRAVRRRTPRQASPLRRLQGLCRKAKIAEVKVRIGPKATFVYYPIDRVRELVEQ